MNLKMTSKSGRNSSGHITVRHRGGASFSFFKRVDLMRVEGTDGKMIDYHYDKHRTCFLGLINYFRFGNKSFVLAPEDILNKKVSNGFLKMRNSIGDCSPIGWMETKTIIFNVERYPYSGGFFARSAGTFCKIIQQSRNWVRIKIPSGLVFKMSPYCMATVGRASNVKHRFEHYSYAGYFRHLGIRPSVRGEAMNAVDHPHGGRTKGGRPVMSPWGKVMK